MPSPTPRRLALSLLSLPFLLVLACTPPTTQEPDAGQTHGDAGQSQGDAGPADGGELLADAGGEPDAGPPNGTVEWSKDLPNPYTLPRPDDEDGVLDPNALDFLLGYNVVLPDPNVPEAVLVKRICTQLATESQPTCFESEAPAVEGQGGSRWGLDPSQYESGFNVYEHILQLKQDGTVIDEDTLRFEVTAP